MEWEYSTPIYLFVFFSPLGFCDFELVCDLCDILIVWNGLSIF
jgi:hypothetical protein